MYGMYLCGNSVGVVDDPDGDVVISQRNDRRNHVAPRCLCVLAVEVDAVYNRLSYTHVRTKQKKTRERAIRSPLERDIFVRGQMHKTWHLLHSSPIKVWVPTPIQYPYQQVVNTSPRMLSRIRQRS